MIYAYLLPPLLVAGRRCSFPHQIGDDYWGMGPFWTVSQEEQGAKLNWSINLLRTCRTIREDLTPLVYQNIAVLFDRLSDDMSSLLNQELLVFSCCRSLSVQIDECTAGSESSDWGEKLIFIRSLTRTLCRFTTLQQLTLQGILIESTDEGRIWICSRESVAILRACVKARPGLSAAFFKPWPKSPLGHLLPWPMVCADVRFAPPGTLRRASEWAIDVEQETTARNDHIRAFRYQNMRGLSSNGMQGTDCPLQRGNPRTVQPRDILEAAGVIKSTKCQTRVKSLASELSEADLVRMCFLGMFLLGPLMHLLDRSGPQHAGDGHETS